MKKIIKSSIPLLFVLLSSIATFSQKIPEGTTFIGGDFSFGYQHANVQNTSKTNIFSLGIAPSFTKFKRDNFSVNYVIGYSVERNSVNPFITNQSYYHSSSIHGFVVGMYFKNYKMLTEKMGLSVQYGGNITFSSYLPSPIGVRTVSLNIGAGPSIIYLINERIAIEGTAMLLNLNASYSKTPISNNFSVGTGLNGSPSLGFGIRYFAKKKAKN